MPAPLRNRARVYTLAAGATMLGSLALLDVYALTAPIETAPIMPGATASPSLGTTASQSASSGRHTNFAELKDLTGRPIFHQDRKPAPREVAAAHDAVENGPPGFELVGLMEGADGNRRAMIRSGEQPAGWIGKGDRIDGWQVTTIESDQVTIEASGQKASLKLYARP